MRILIGYCAMVFCFSCTKDKLPNRPNTQEVSRVITPKGGTLVFRTDLDLISNQPLLTLKFPANAVSKDIPVEIFTIRTQDLNVGKFIPVSDVLFLYPKSTTFSAPVGVNYYFHIPTPEDNIYNYQNIFQPSFLYGRLGNVKLFEISYTRPMPFDIGKEQNWKVVPAYSLDTATGLLQFEVNDFSKAYCLAFPEYQRNDTLTIKSSLKPFTFSQVNQDYQDHVNQGFMGLNGNNYFNNTVTFGDTVIFLKLNYSGIGKGIFNGADLDFSISGYYLDWSGTSVDTRFFDTYTEWGNTTLEIYEYGAIGQRVRGRITGTVQKDFGNVIMPINYYFNSIRTR